MDFSIYEAKTKVLISCAVTTQLICAFVFTKGKSRFSQDAAHIYKRKDLHNKAPLYSI